MAVFQNKALQDLLTEIALFQDLKSDSQALLALCAVLEEKSYEPGKAIIEEGEGGSEMYFLLQGEASVLKKSAAGDVFKVATLTSGAHPFFGEGCMIDAESRSATIVANTPCICAVLKREQFDRFCKDHPAWGILIYRRVASAVLARLRKTNTDLSLLYNALVDEIRGLG